MAVLTGVGDESKFMNDDFSQRDFTPSVTSDSLMLRVDRPPLRAGWLAGTADNLMRDIQYCVALR